MFGLSATTVAAVAGAGASVYSASQSGDSATTTQQASLDPRMQAMLYGGSPNDTGLLGRYTSYLDAPQNAGSATFGQQQDDYLKNWAGQSMAKSQQTAEHLQGSSYNAPQMDAAKIQAPNQNNLNLNPAYDQMIYGDSAQNPYLTGALQKGVNQSNTAFGNMMDDSTRNLTENILPGIRSGAIVNGAMGGSRQGIAEGRALSDYSTQMGRAMSQYGQNNTDTILGAQANAYESGQNRAAGAMAGLSGNQYQTAAQDASFAQQANAANQQSRLATDRLNSTNMATGIGLSNGLLGSSYNYANAQDQYDINKAGAVNGLLTPYTGYGASQTQTQPLYQNTAGNLLGGATAGLGLYNSLNKYGGYNNSPASNGWVSGYDL